MTKITSVPVTEITPGDNDRQRFDWVALEELAQSISEHGLAQPITVRPIWTCSSCGRRDPDFPQWCDACDNDSFHHHYEIVAGERRFRAIRDILKQSTIPAIVRTDLDDESASAIMLVENTSRADLSPIEEATAYRARIERFEWSLEHIAEVAGVSVGLVKRRLSLLDLTSEIQHLVAFGNIPLGHAEAMTKLDSNRQRIALRIFRESKKGIPLAHFRTIVNQLLEEQSQDSLFDLENFWIKQVQASAEPPKMGKKAITALAEALDAAIFDVRFSPRSRVPHWSGKRLSVLLGTRYQHVRAFGNANYKGGPIEIVDFEAGLQLILESPKPVILMCVCKNPTICHRTTIGNRLSGAGFQFTELNGPGAQMDPTARRARQLAIDL